ncbi:MAG TPA: hypothetical protein VH415_08875 [Nitrososphaeraceae archaeon]
MTDRSYEGICGGSGDPLPCGLGDISHGETAYFSPLAEITVDIPETLPLSIFTGGAEIDQCGRDHYVTENVNPTRILRELSQPEETWDSSIQDEAKAISSQYGAYAFNCPFNENDRIGSIIKFYKAPDYDAGTHEEFATNLDYILRYTITVTPSQNIQSNKGIFNTDNFSTSNDFVTNNKFSASNNFSTANNFQSQPNSNDFSNKLNNELF